jgi:hypothetical protein
MFEQEELRMGASKAIVSLFLSIAGAVDVATILFG